MFKLNELLYEFQDKKIVVTGGAGFIGSNLSNFLAKSANVFAIDNLVAGSWDRCKPEVEIKQLDISTCNESEIFELLDGADYLFHLAAVKKHNSLNSFEKINLSNIVATERLFRLAATAKVRRSVFTSSLYAYGSMGPAPMSELDVVDPLTHYGLSKFIGEKLLKIAFEKNNLSYVIPRLFFIYGPNQYALGGYKSIIFKSFENILRGAPVEIYGSGLQTLDYVYIDDCIMSLLLLALSDYKGVVNISTSVPTSIKQLIGEINKITGNNSILRSLADWTEGSQRVGENTLLKEITGFVPDTTISQGLHKTWTWMNEVKI